MNKDVARLLDRLYKDLYKSDEVIHHGGGNVYDKFNNIESYINDLERIHNKVSETGRHKDYLKKLYYDKYVIKPEDIKESYYHHQQEIALERGFGHIKITEQQKRQMQEEIINNQKTRLDTWLDYFLSTDANVYPFWAKYWAFQGMLKLGTYDKEKGTFNRRTKDTIEPFCDLNREALAMSIDMLIKMLNKEEFDDKELEVLVKTGSFQKIYTYILNHVLKDNKNITKRNIGKWVKYDQGSDHMPLVNSLQEYNTGWCTAGESTAKSQLEHGDFYVYYTLDENDEYKVPRIAIRMEYGKIAEIRGVAINQNLESEMEEVVEEKIKDFPDKEEYYKKVNDMKLLTRIYKKQQNKEELTKEEIIFLYEICDQIKGFGYENDPRIEEIKNERVYNKDLRQVFDGSIKEIKGDLDLSKLKDAEGLVLPQRVEGNLDLSGLTSAKGLVLPEKIGGDLDLAGLISTDGLVLPQSISGNLDLSELSSAKGLKLPEYIGGHLNLRSLINSDGLILPKSISSNLYLSGLTSAKGLVLPQSIGGTLYLRDLKDVKDLVFPKNIEYSLVLSGLTSAKDLILPESIVGNLDLSGLTSAKDLVLPQSIGGDLWLSSLKTAEGLVLPQIIGGSLGLGGLTSVGGLVLPQSIGDSLDLSGLTSVEGLVLPQSIGGDLWLSSLKTAEGLVFPPNIGGILGLQSLTSIKGLVLPQNIGRGLLLNSLTNIEGLNLPENIGGLVLSSLTSAKGLKLPKYVEYDLVLDGLTNVEGLVLPQSIGGDLWLSSLTSAKGLGLPRSVKKNVWLEGLTCYEDLVIPDPLTYEICFKYFKITPENVHQYRKNKKHI